MKSLFSRSYTAVLSRNATCNSSRFFAALRSVASTSAGNMSYAQDALTCEVEYGCKEELIHRVVKDPKPFTPFEIVSTIEMLRDLKFDCSRPFENTVCKSLVAKFLQLPLDYLDHTKTSLLLYCISQTRFTSRYLTDKDNEKLSKRFVYCIPKNNSQILRTVLQTINFLNPPDFSPGLSSDVKAAIIESLLSLPIMSTEESGKVLKALAFSGFTTNNLDTEANAKLFDIMMQAVKCRDPQSVALMLRNIVDITHCTHAEVPAECWQLISHRLDHVFGILSVEQQIKTLKILGQMKVPFTCLSSIVQSDVMIIVSRPIPPSSKFSDLIISLGHMRLSYGDLRYSEKKGFDDKLTNALEAPGAREPSQHNATVIEALALTGFQWFDSGEVLIKVICDSLMKTTFTPKQCHTLVYGLAGIKCEFMLLSPEMQQFVIDRLNDIDHNIHTSTTLRMLTCLTQMRMSWSTLKSVKSIESAVYRVACGNKKKANVVILINSLAALDTPWDSLSVKTREMMANTFISNLQYFNNSLIQQLCYNLSVLVFDSSEHSDPSSPLSRIHKTLTDYLLSDAFRVDNLMLANSIGSYVEMLQLHPQYAKVGKAIQLALFRPLVSNKPTVSNESQRYTKWIKPILLPFPVVNLVTIAVCEQVRGEYQPIGFAIVNPEADCRTRSSDFRVTLLKKYYPSLPLLYCVYGENVVRAVVRTVKPSVTSEVVV